MQSALVFVSAVPFLFFGAACFVSSYMKQEFIRYGLAGFRTTVGTLQILGALGLLAGFASPALGRCAAGGLAILMLLGVGVRIKIHDTLLQTTPATFFMLLNAWICIFGYEMG